MKLLPIGARIPPEWIREASPDTTIIVVPGRGTGPGAPPTYDIEVDHWTWAMFCPCRGYQNRGDCSHLDNLIRFTVRPPRARRPPAGGPADTSIESYRQLTPEDLDGRKKQVFEVIRDRGPCSNRFIREFLNLPNNVSTPRVKELRDAGLVEMDHLEMDTVTNRRVQMWRVVGALPLTVSGEPSASPSP